MAGGSRAATVCAPPFAFAAVTWLAIACWGPADGGRAAADSYAAAMAHGGSAVLSASAGIDGAQSEAGEATEASARAPARARATHRAEAESYHRRCRDAGIPVPGPLASDPGWSKATALDPEAHRYFFRSNWTRADVQTYRSAEGGFCIALTRRNPRDPSQAPLIGTICTDRQQSKACFFDNIVYDGDATRRLGWDEAKLSDFGAFVHPFDGQDRCNACHLGQNPFIVHPETILGRTVMSMYAQDGPKPARFEYVGLEGEHESWRNFEPIARVGGPEDACMRCHELPRVTPGHPFCSGVLQMALNRTMPPGQWPAEPTGTVNFWPDKDGCFPRDLETLKSYFASVARLKSICTGMPVRTCNRTK